MRGSNLLIKNAFIHGTGIAEYMVTVQEQEEQVISTRISTDILEQPKTIEQLQRDNTALRAEIEALRSFKTLAYHDELTGLHNRRYFEERLREELSRSCRHPERHFSVALLDVNDFKKINDRYGHAVGDETLKWVADFVGANLRQHDIFCRLGGDEFIIILPDTSIKECHRAINRLRKRLKEENKSRKFLIEIAIGVASWPEDGNSARRLIEIADASMYRDKTRQKGFLMINDIPSYGHTNSHTHLGL